MRAEFIQLEIEAGPNTNKLLRRDGKNRRMPIGVEVVGMLLRAKRAGLSIDFKRLQHVRLTNLNVPGYHVFWNWDSL